MRFKVGKRDLSPLVSISLSLLLQAGMNPSSQLKSSRVGRHLAGAHRKRLSKFEIRNSNFEIPFHSFKYPINVAAKRLNPYVSITFCLSCSG